MDTKEYKTKEQQKKFYNSAAWEKKRKEVLERSNYECEWCKAEGKVTTKERMTLEVDHIKELSEYPELALEDSNLRVLCKYHHNQRHKRFGFQPKKKWDDELW